MTETIEALRVEWRNGAECMKPYGYSFHPTKQSAAEIVRAIAVTKSATVTPVEIRPEVIEAQLVQIPVDSLLARAISEYGKVHVVLSESPQPLLIQAQKIRASKEPVPIDLLADNSPILAEALEASHQSLLNLARRHLCCG